MGFTLKVARTGVLGFICSMARSLTVGFNRSMARKASMGFTAVVARTTHLGFNGLVARTGTLGFTIEVARNPLRVSLWEWLASLQWVSCGSWLNTLGPCLTLDIFKYAADLPECVRRVF